MNTFSSHPNLTIVSIDGGAAVGKSSVARALAQAFNWLHVDTGMHYRAITYSLLQAGIKPDQTQQIESHLAQLNLTTHLHGLSACIGINQEALPAAKLKTQSINAVISFYAAVPAIRHFLLAYQRQQPQVAHQKGLSGLIMEGRDIGSVVFPDAHLKFFLKADPNVRQSRREQESGNQDNIHQRDAIDQSRKDAPLMAPPSAIIIDTTLLSLEDVIDHMREIICASRVATKPVARL